MPSFKIKGMKQVGKQPAFFLSKFEEFERDHPEAFKKTTRKVSEPKKFDCTTCGLKEKCLSGRIERYGKGKKKILIVGLCPGKQEDYEGVPFIGLSGEFLRSSLDLIGINLYRDCVRTNIVQCAVRKKNQYGGSFYSTPSNKSIKCCNRNLEKDIEEVKPSMIICCGGEALAAVLSTSTLKKFPITKVHGKTFPSHKWNCWIGASFHPSHIIRGGKRDEALFRYDLVNIISYLDEPLPEPLTKKGNVLVWQSQKAIRLLKELSESSIPVSIDYETTTLSSFDKNARLLTVGLSNDVTKGYCIHLDNPEWNLIEQAAVYHELKNFLLSNAPKVVQNINMEELWGRSHVGASLNNFHWDTMVSSHVLNCRSGTTSLGFQVFEMTGHEYKKMVDTSNLEDETIEDISDYNCWDARYQLMSYYKQFDEMSDDQKEFNKLLHNSLPALANLKNRGIRIDRTLLNKFHIDYTAVLKEQSCIISNDPGVLEFEKKHDKKCNVNSSKQLSEVLYDIYRVPSVKKTKTGESTDEETLKIISSKTNNENVKEFLKTLLRHRKISGFLAKIEEFRREMDSNDCVHPSYNLNIAESFRSSVNNPQVQNVYKRDEEFRKFRKVFIPSPGNIFLEVDYDGLEVKVIAMASKDPELTRQIVAGIDPHRKWASELYCKDPKDITDTERYNAKNKMVFPSFYGSVVNSICLSFPEINSKHVERTQNLFWEEYSGVKSWQNSVLDFYNKNGFIIGLSGFRRPGPLSDMQLYNTPIQGTAFHLLLDALEKIDNLMISKGMLSRIVSEVHDSLLIDTNPDEVEEVIELTERIMCLKRFSWQTVPLSVSWEIGENWYDMEKI
ncbi:MAG: DNA polymerase [Candidatus Heimdallarchaeaceae archaeon]